MALGWSADQDFFIDKESTKTKWWRSAALWDDNVCENQITSIPAGLTWRTKWLIKVLNSFVTSQKWRTLSFFLPNLQLVFSAWTHLKCQENYHWKNAFKWGILSHFRYFRDPKSQCLNFCAKNNIYFGGTSLIYQLFEFSRQNGKTCEKELNVDFGSEFQDFLKWKKELATLSSLRSLKAEIQCLW